MLDKSLSMEKRDGSMNSRFLNTSAGRRGYAPFATILLLAFGVGVAAFLYFSQKRAEDTRAGGPGSLHQQEQIEEKMLQELGKSRNRYFSDEQVALLKRELSPKTGESIAIECQLGDVEGCYLALEINLVFEASGWIVEEFLFAVQHTPGEALIMRVKDESMLPRAERLSRLFRSVGLSVTTQTDGGQLCDLKIVVPSKKAQAGTETPA
jgi:hypothetical protein